MSSSSKDSPSPAPRRKIAAVKKPVSLEDESTVFCIIRNGKSSVQKTVDEWIEQYKADRDSGLCAILQFFIGASGCKGKITSQMQSSMENAAIIRRMTEEFDEESDEYPIIMSGPQWKKFRSNFCDFVQTLVKQCQYSIIYDQYLMDNVISLLTSLSDSQVRVFRHTATLAAMKFMTALVEVALTVSIHLDNTSRQYEAERQKTSDERASDRLEVLIAKHQELEKNMDEIKELLTYTFKSIFVHRYRDTVTDIRAICMAEIGIWMRRFPQNFLDDSYLKYVGWTLNDKVGDVRLKCLQALQPLYASEQLKGKLELFTSKFKDRVVSMTLDIDCDVAVQAVRFVINILKYHREVLLDKDCEAIYVLVFSSRRAVAQAAGEFLNERLFALDDTSPPALRTHRGKKRLPNRANTPLIRDLVQFFIESELHEHGAYLVDSLIDSNEMMKDWECMTDFLMEDPGPGEESLDDEQETSLIELMTCCIKQAATGESPVGRKPARKVTTTKQIHQVQEDRVRLTEHFIQTLPLLLGKFIADPEKVASNAKNTLFDYLDKRLRDVLKEPVTAGDEDQVFALVSSLEKVAIFSSSHNLGPWNLWDPLFNAVREANDPSHSMPPEAIKHCISACYSGILWELLQLENGSRRGTSASQQQKQLRDHLDAYILLMKELAITSNVALVRDQAYMSVCDLLIAFSKKLEGNPLLRPVVYQPDRDLQQTLNNFIQKYVFVEEEDEEIDEETQVEALHKRRSYLSNFCKLVVYNVLPIQTAADVFRHYVKCDDDYGDIIKMMLGKAREINKVSCARTMVLSLSMLFRDLSRDAGSRIDRQSEGFFSVKELAKRFALSFGLDAVKNREAITALHRDAILFATNPPKNPNDPTGPPPNLAFLEIAAEFTKKLLKQDKRTVLQFLDRLTVERHSSRGREWEPLMLYRNPLVHGETDLPPQTSRRAYGRRRRDTGGDDGEIADDNDDAGSDQEMAG
ncbi:putative stromalin antigen protein, SA-D [Daphnia pulex]|uniref:Putative stromalin antigen protein, SA-D n=1 Tax=Daphnia pulex TaxID=6669 RepID=E9FV25_DAPPU|nr:putative stromalin antigen protein, SA-D [Daphnia pulex]|eukprot:EFX88480.1 putative stromalin antigen protein, SA-D [Daphnia pulex]